MKIQLVERQGEDGEMEYGVQHHDGHINWYASMAQAAYILSDTLERKAKDTDK